MVTDEDVNIFLEHHGVKGMQWGLRKAKSVGSGTVKTVKWAKDHKKTTIAIGVGAAFAGMYLSNKIAKRKVKDIAKLPLTSQGKSWITSSKNSNPLAVSLKILTWPAKI